MKYTGIGSRNQTKEQKLIIYDVAQKLASLGCTVRSGNANGADKTFQKGACSINENMTESFLPWDGFNQPYIGKVFTPSKEMLKFAKDQLESTGVLPYIYNMSQANQRFHGRNYFQVVGIDNVLSDFCVYSSPEKDGIVEGGTRTAVYLCRYFGVQTFNIRIESELNNLILKIDNMEKNNKHI